MEASGSWIICFKCLPGSNRKKQGTQHRSYRPLTCLMAVYSFSSYRDSNIKTQLFHICTRCVYMHLFMYIINNQMVYNCFIQVDSLSRIFNPWEAEKLEVHRVLWRHARYSFYSRSSLEEHSSPC